jgi:thiamine biosynthesis lipoprotein
MTYTEEQCFMNTIIRFQIISSKGTVFTKSRARGAFSIFDQVVKKFSRFNPKSELSAMNNSYPHSFVASKELFDLVKISLDINKKGKGFYDPTLIDVLESYGYDQKQDFSKLDKPEFYKELENLVSGRKGPKEIEIDEKTKKIKLQKGQRLDLGSIAKGYAVDLAYEYLKKDFDQFLINAGGDVRVGGVNEQGLPWKIMLFKAPLPNQAPPQDCEPMQDMASPKDKTSNQNRVAKANEFLGYVELEPGFSIAGSGGWARRVGAFHHLLNPKDGLPINHISQTYVIAPDAQSADAYATFLFVEGPQALPVLEKIGLSGLLIDFRGNISKSETFNYFKI